MSKNELSKLMLDEFNNQKKSQEGEYASFQQLKFALISNLNDDDSAYILQKAKELNDSLLIDALSNLNLNIEEEKKLKVPTYTLLITQQYKNNEHIETTEKIKSISTSNGNEDNLLTMEQEEDNINQILTVLSEIDYVHELVVGEKNILDKITNMLDIHHSELSQDPVIDLAALIHAIEENN